MAWIYNAILSSVSGMSGQSNAISTISGNVANIDSVGCKAGDTNFFTLITTPGATDGSSVSGITTRGRQFVDQQGVIESTSVATDLAISRNGIFVVNSVADKSGTFMYTRAGSFRTDNGGNFQNALGDYLMGWPLDNQGKLPDATGNLNTTSNALLQSLQPINLTSFTDAASMMLDRNYKSPEDLNITPFEENNFAEKFEINIPDFAGSNISINS